MVVAAAAADTDWGSPGGDLEERYAESTNGSGNGGMGVTGWFEVVRTSAEGEDVEEGETLKLGCKTLAATRSSTAFWVWQRETYH